MGEFNLKVLIAVENDFDETTGFSTVSVKDFAISMAFEFEGEYEDDLVKKVLTELAESRLLGSLSSQQLKEILQQAYEQEQQELGGFAERILPQVE